MFVSTIPIYVCINIAIDVARLKVLQSFTTDSFFKTSLLSFS